MQNVFQTIKAKKRTRALAMSALFGVCVAFCVLGTLLLIFRTNDVAFRTLYYVLIGVGSALLVGGVLFLILFPYDKVLAKSLDKKYNLREKAQTLVAFKGDDSAMAQLQRQDAQARLEELPIKTFSLKDIILSACSFLLAVVLFVSGLLVPPPVENVPPGGGGTPPPTFAITEYQKISLQNLVEKVQNSDAQEDLKTFTVAELTALYNGLVNITTEELLYEQVGLVIVSIDTAVETVNTYKKIYLAIRPSTQTALQRLAKAIGNQDAVNHFKLLRQEFVSETQDKAEALSKLTNFANDAKTSLANAAVDKTDGLYKTTEEFLTALLELPSSITDSMNYAYVQDSIAAQLNADAVRLDVLLGQQKVNRETVTDCIKELIEIFAIPANKVPSWGGDTLVGLEDEDNNENNDDSGSIEEGVKYPSKEKIYDYYTKKLSEYGVAFDGETYNYKGEMNSTLQGSTEMPDEIKAIVDIYIALLSGVQQQPTN